MTVTIRTPARHLSVVAPEPQSPARAALTGYVDDQADAIFAGDRGLRRGDDPIHDTRAAIRRFRSTVHVFRPVLGADAAAHVDGELKWFTDMLGVVRDCQVQRRRLGAALDRLPDTLVLGPVVSDVRNHLASVELPARARVDEAMDSQRYLAMIAVVRWWRVRPVIATEPAAEALVAMARHAARKADRRLALAFEAADRVSLHAAHKAVRRARHAAELVRPMDVPGKPKSKRYKRIQRLLGDHRDAAVASALLRRIGAAKGAEAARNGFTYGLLFEREQNLAADTRRAIRELL